MAIDRDLHRRLIARQSDGELERKADKAWMRRGKLWTQEELDAAGLHEVLVGDPVPYHPY